MSKEAETISEAIAMLVEWNDRASAFIKRNRDYWDDGTDENDKEFDQVTISFDRAGLDLFMANQEKAAVGLRILQSYVEEKEA